MIFMFFWSVKGGVKAALAATLASETIANQRTVTIQRLVLYRGNERSCIEFVLLLDSTLGTVRPLHRLTIWNSFQSGHAECMFRLFEQATRSPKLHSSNGSKTLQTVFAFLHTTLEDDKAWLCLHASECPPTSGPSSSPDVTPPPGSRVLRTTRLPYSGISHCGTIAFGK